MGISINSEIKSNNPSTPGSSTGPLATLYSGSDQNCEILKYPSDLGSDKRNHYVQLYIKNIDAAGYESKNQGKLNSVSGINLGNVGSNIIDTVAGAIDSLKNAISDPTLNKLFGANFSFSFTPQTTKTVSVISLYMPDTLAASYNASYDSLSLTNNLGATAKTAQAIATVGGSFTGDSQGNISSMGAGVLVAGEQLFGGKAAKAGLDYKNISDLLLKGQGLAINPQMQMIYRGTNFRSFQLTFMFTPSTKSEAETVNRIINTLKYHFAPTLASGATSNQSMFLVAPSIFNVVFKLAEKENQFLPKYGDCVLENIDVDNAPNGWASYDDGAPVQTRLTLQFKEIVILDRGKINDGVNGLDGGLR